jgi:hypothetical protein
MILNHYRRIAWTGGDVPRRGIVLADNERGRKYRHMRHIYFRELLKAYTEYWHELPNKDTRKIMWNWASLDAWATLTRQ